MDVEYHNAALTILLNIETVMFDSLKTWAKRLKRDVIALMFASRDPATPVIAKCIAGLTVAYALSPIDLIPDFIPIIGFLDDVILVPVGIWLSLRLIPSAVLVNSRAKAEIWLSEKRHKPRSMLGLALVVAAWLACAFCAWAWFRR